MYIIQEGQAVVSQLNDTSAANISDGGEADTSLLRILKEGDYFGERALLYEERRSATVTAASQIKLMVRAQYFRAYAMCAASISRG